jgi:hypothetical protein
MTDAGRAAFAESAVDTSGFTALNADGSFGPYETVDQPVFSDRGGYIQASERWERFSDQYGNGYYLDLGPAPQAQPQATLVPTPSSTPVPASSPAPITLPTPQPFQRTAAEEISVLLAQVNKERVSNGLQPLVEDPAPRRICPAIRVLRGCTVLLRPQLRVGAVRRSTTRGLLTGRGSDQRGSRSSCRHRSLGRALRPPVAPRGRLAGRARRGRIALFERV